MEDLPAGNAGAFAQRLGTMRPKLHRYCARMTGSVIDGEDVVQEAMIKAIGAFPLEAGIENVEAWVFRIAHNCALDLLRRRTREADWVVAVDTADVPDPGAGAEERLAAAASLRTFMHLAPAQRAAVILMDVLGYSLQEIATVLEASVAAVKAALHRGRMRLRELAREPAGVPPPALDAADLAHLSRYVERFNAHDFDAIRAMLAEDVRLDLVNRVQNSGRPAVSRYFGNYSSRSDWRLAVGLVEGRPAILAYEAGETPVYFVLLDWRSGEIAGIRDFRYARYALESAEVAPLP